MDDYIAKPFQTEVLMNVLEAHAPSRSNALGFANQSTDALAIL